jgi:hypothetical protein
MPKRRPIHFHLTWQKFIHVKMTVKIKEMNGGGSEFEEDEVSNGASLNRSGI